MCILVTGASGFIGSQICRSLVAEGYPVRAFHRPQSPQLALEGLPVEHATGDITRPETLAAAMQGVEAVFHTAAQMRQRNPAQAYMVTVEGTRNVLRAASEAGVRRVVHTSSVAALGVPLESGHGAALLMDEHHTWNYRPEWWPYGYAKYMAELAVQEAVAQGLDVVIVNPAVVIGAGDLNRISGNIVVQMAKRRLPVAPPGGLNVIHIEDAVRGHLAALKHGRTGERYILGGENLTHLQFLKLAAEVVGVRPPRFVLPRRLVQMMARPVAAAGRWLPLPFNAKSLRRIGYFFYYDTLKARTELNLRELRSTREALAGALGWYRAQGVA